MIAHHTGTSAPRPISAPDELKRVTTLQAIAARRGFELRPIVNSNGRHTYLVSNWNLVRELADLRAVERFIDQIGAKA